MSGLLKLYRSKRNPPALPTTSFKDKTILITGSNTGLGLAAAQHFLRLQATHVILAVRSLAKGEAARVQLEREFNKKGAISVLHLDMNDSASIRGFAERVRQDFDRIDVAVLNAGLVNKEWNMSSEGWEEMLQVNTLGTTLLALLLLPVLRETKAKEPEEVPRMVLVSSGTHFNVKREALPDPTLDIYTQLSKKPDESKPGVSGQKQYAISKLLLMYNVVHLAALGKSVNGEESEVLVTSCCPGMVKTDLGRQYKSWWMLPILWLVFLLARTPEQGSRTLVTAATLGEKEQGVFWKNDQVVPPNELVTSKEGREIGDKVWAETLEILEKKVPEVKDIAARKP